MILHEYEEYKPISALRSWLAILLLAIVTVGWGMVAHMTIPDVERHWDFDVLPDTPGSSPYATLVPPNVSPVPPQIEPRRNHVEGLPGPDASIADPNSAMRME